MRCAVLRLTLGLTLLLSSAAIAADIDEYNDVPEGLLLDKRGAAVVTDDKKNAADAGNVMSIDDVVKAYNAGKYEQIGPRLKTLADKGNAMAAEFLGIMHHNGQGVEKNAVLAAKYLTQAAEAARPLAQHHLAVMYYLGNGVEKNLTQALMWLHLAIVYYPEGAEKKRAMEDRDGIYSQISRREKERAMELTREWLEKRGDSLLLDLQ